MAVAFDAFTVGTPGTGNLTHNHASVGTPRGVTAWVVQIGSAADQVSGLTFGGTAATRHSFVPHTGGGDGDVGAVYCYKLNASIPTGTQACATTVTGSATKVVYCTTVTAAADTEIVDTETWDTNSVLDPSGTLSLSGRTCWVGMGGASGRGGSGEVTPLSGWTSRNELSTGSQVGFCYTYDTVGSTDVTVGATQAADDFWAIAVAVSEVSGTSYTLTADAGSFAVTGTDASLEFGRRVSADSGAFAITGTDAGLVYTMVVNGTPGEFNITGTDATLLYNRRLAADAGSFAVTGTDASLEFNRRLSAESGSFAVTGTDATLTYDQPGAYTLTAESGSFGVTGADASLLYGRKLTAEAGSFAMTASDAGLLLHRVLAAAAGAFAWTGTAATLTYDASNPDPASYSVWLTGSRTRTYTTEGNRTDYAVGSRPRTFTTRE